MARKKHARANGNGTLELHGRLWRARWTVNGKTYTRPTGTSDKREAAKKLEEFTAPFRLGADKQILEGLAAKVQGVTAELKAYEDTRPATSLAGGFAAYRASSERPDTGAATMDMYESQYTRLAKWMAKHYPTITEMRHVSKQVAEEFMADIAKRYSANTFNKYATLFTRIWETLKETARLEANPWEKIAHKNEDKGQTRRELTVDELRRVCESAEGEMRTLFAVGIYTGLRLGDCALLEWGNVDLARRMVAVIPRKTAKHAHGRPVVIPIHGTLANILEETPSADRTGYVMPQTAKAYLADRAAVTVKIQAAFKACGIRTNRKGKDDTRAVVEVGFHSLRHTFVSMAANAGVPLALIQSIVGHTSTAMTRHYFHESEDALKNAVAALPDVGGAIALPDGAARSVAVPCAFCAILDGMTREQLEAARAEIDKRLAKAE
ncbi:MAG: site-specific integrase [Kiritimatiellae bacterium]|nr:site-specific integrase [Kiritimatiellia bacterium]